MLSNRYKLLGEDMNRRNIVKFLLLLMVSFQVYASDTILTVAYTSPGIDEGTDTLLPGSDWRLEITPDASTSCEVAYPGTTFYKTTIIPVTSYIDSNLDCSTEVHAGFEGENIDWVFDGFIQLQSFGLESITCPFTGSCPIERVINNKTKFLDNIELDNGQNGTLNGAAKVFLWKVNNVVISSVPGTGGVGGVNDLSFMTSEKRYCVDVVDATSPDANEQVSKVPYATIESYDWQPFNVSQEGSQGSDAPSGKKVEVFTGMSPSLIEMIKSDYMN
jgi:hypothetical protein